MSYIRYPSSSSGTANVPTYANVGSFPASPADGAPAVALDTGYLYIYHQATTSWIVQEAGPLSGDVTSSTAGGPTTVASVGGATASSVASTVTTVAAAASTSTAGAIVKRDGSGNFSAGTITANLTGNVTGNASGSAASFTGSLSGDVTGTQGATTVGKINGTALSGLATGILKNTTATGVPSIAIAADFPTLNQNTTGTAANITASSNSTLTTLSALSLPGSQVSGNISGNAANVTGTVAIGSGGTGQTTATNAFNALAPATAKGGMVIGSGANTYTNLAVGSNGYQLVSDSNATNGFRWQPQPWSTKNYMSPLGDFELGAVTGWSLSHSTLSGGVPNQTSASWTSQAGTMSAALTGTALSGSNSLQIAFSAATVAGDMLVSTGRTIDPSDQGKTVRWRCGYKITSGAGNGTFAGDSTNSFGVFIYDVTNNAWITPDGVYTINQSASGGTAQGSFTAPATMASFRIAIVNLNATAGAITYVVDDFHVGPTVVTPAPTIQKFTSGSGTYTTPAGVRYIRVRMVGGGGGGGGSAATGNNDGGTGSAGGNSTFGTSLLVANGGSGGNKFTPQAAGTASLGTGPIGTAIAGGIGAPGTFGSGQTFPPAGGNGGSSAFGGAGAGSTNGLSSGSAAAANSGSGGGGAVAGTGSATGAGGSSGGYVDAIITSPSATYSYAVGAAGSGGGAGTGGAAGGAGGSGYIEVTEYS